jgi:spermidine/putrescine transport system ATP-binding protein
VEKKVLIKLINLAKGYDGQNVVDGINLDIYDGEFVTLLGPSGCGKTTTLRMIGGFVKQDTGDIVVEDKIINDLPAYARPINTVFQKYALFPHLNIYENIAFGLKNRKNDYLVNFYHLDSSLDKKELKKLIKESINKDVLFYLKLVGLEGFENRKVDQISGGQAQRVALARALINKPKILLLDEPLSALDLKLRQSMQYELKDMQKKLGITFIFVTHDQEEAMTMSDRIVVMENGKIIQVDTPRKIYNEPINKYVTRFVGESNIFKGVYLRKDKVKFLNTNFDCVGYTFEKNEKVNVVIRPEDWDVVDLDKAIIVAVVTDSIFKGVHNEITAYVDDTEITVNSYENYEVGSKIGLKVDPYEIHIMPLEIDDLENTSDKASTYNA